MGRARVDSVKMQFQMPRYLRDELLELVPELKNPRGTGRAAHGKLSRYFTTLVTNDLQRRKQARSTGG